MSEPLVLRFDVQDDGSVKVERIRRELDGVERELDKAGGRAKQLDKSLGALGSSLTWLKNQLFSVKGALAALGVGMVLREFISTSAEMQKLRFQMETLTGSVEAGKRQFKELREYAGRVPFEFREVAQAGVMLRSALGTNTQKTTELVRLAGDLAARSGLSIQEAAGQLVRMWAAGAAAADQFRERGVLAMLGFKAGVQYSVEETRKRLMDAWNDPEKRIKGAAEKLSGTWGGIISMIKDKITDMIGIVTDSGVFQAMQNQLSRIDTAFSDFIANNRGAIERWGKSAGEAIRGFADSMAAIGPDLGRMIAGVGRTLAGLFAMLRDSGVFHAFAAGIGLLARHANLLALALRVIVSIAIARYLSGLTLSIQSAVTGMTFMTGRLTLYRLGVILAAGATNAFRVALRLLGGPVGVVWLVIEALIQLAFYAKHSSDELDASKMKVEKLAQQLEDLARPDTLTGAKDRVTALRKELQETYRLIALEKGRDTSKVTTRYRDDDGSGRMVRRMTTDPALPELEAKRDRLQADLAKLEGAIGKVEDRRKRDEEANKIMGGPEPPPVPEVDDGKGKGKDYYNPYAARVEALQHEIQLQGQINQLREEAGEISSYDISLKALETEREALKAAKVKAEYDAKYQDTTAERAKAAQEVLSIEAEIKALDTVGDLTKKIEGQREALASYDRQIKTMEAGRDATVQRNNTLVDAGLMRRADALRVEYDLEDRLIAKREAGLKYELSITADKVKRADIQAELDRLQDSTNEKLKRELELQRAATEEAQKRADILGNLASILDQVQGPLAGVIQGPFAYMKHMADYESGQGTFGQLKKQLQAQQAINAAMIEERQKAGQSVIDLMADQQRNELALTQLHSANMTSAYGMMFQGIQNTVSNFSEAMGNESAAMIGLQKGLAVANAIMQAHMAASAVFAATAMSSMWSGGEVAIGKAKLLSSITLALGYANAAMIAATPTRMHGGGYVDDRLGADEVNRTLQRGEYVVSRRGVDALDRINRGDTSDMRGREVMVEIPLTIVNVADENEVLGVMASERGQNIITNSVTMNAERGGEVRRVIRGKGRVVS